MLPFGATVATRGVGRMGVDVLWWLGVLLSLMVLATVGWIFEG